MSPIRSTSRLLTMLMVGLLALGLWQIGEGSWIYAKARLAQYLLQRAWSRTLTGEATVKPWPWADTWPVARFMVPSRHVDLIILNGAYGRTLAFGPGYVESSAFPGSSRGTTILTGHRDTHFHFLKDLRLNDEIFVQNRKETKRYQVDDIRIVATRAVSIELSEEPSRLILVTCYPFETVTPGGSLRYVVTADEVPEQTIARTRAYLSSAIPSPLPHREASR